MSGMGGYVGPEEDATRRSPRRGPQTTRCTIPVLDRNDEMTVRIVNPVYSCECNSALVFLDHVDNTPRRRMVCRNSGCKHYGQVFLEPVFTALATRSDSQKEWERLIAAETPREKLLRQLQALRDRFFGDAAASDIPFVAGRYAVGYAAGAEAMWKAVEDAVNALPVESITE